MASPVGEGLVLESNTNASNVLSRVTVQERLEGQQGEEPSRAKIQIDQGSSPSTLDLTWLPHKGGTDWVWCPGSNELLAGG